MPESNFSIEGLTESEVLESRKNYGSNRTDLRKGNLFTEEFKYFVKDPMVILLASASLIYSLIDKNAQALFLLAAIVPFTLISVFQRSRKRSALEKLRFFAQPRAKVMRSGKIVQVMSEDVVIGDYLIIEEGTAIAADGIIVHSLDLSVNESVLTDDPMPVLKDKDKEKFIFHGTTVLSGLAFVRVTAIGNGTMLGRIGKSPDSIKNDETPLEKEINIFIQKMIVVSILAFIIVWIINYSNGPDLKDSLLKALTIAMSLMPVEIPVAFTTFMALGYLRLLRMGVIAKQMSTIEMLGSISVFIMNTNSTANTEVQYNKNIKAVLEKLYNAGVKIKFITRDKAISYLSILEEKQFPDNGNSISGDELMMKDPAITEKLTDKDIFTGMFTDAKLRLIQELKANNEIIAVTGSRMNDVSVLREADIGIAVGTNEPEIIKQTASMIIKGDDPEAIVDSIALGRSIYNNLKKAIHYIISIHIPVILTVFIPLAIGWRYPNIFSPLHIILLELLFGTSCSLIYENEPIEVDTMLIKPRPFTCTMFEWKEMRTSITQGAVITLGLLISYIYGADQGLSESKIRTIVFLTLISSNIFLALVNRSFTFSIFKTLKNKNSLVFIVICFTVFIISLVLLVKPLADFFEFEKLSGTEFFFGVICGCISVIWFEMVKFFNKGHEIKEEE